MCARELIFSTPILTLDALVERKGQTDERAVAENTCRAARKDIFSSDKNWNGLKWTNLKLPWDTNSGGSDRLNDEYLLIK